MKVLLTTDGGDHSEIAERLLVRIADRATVDLTVFSVTTYDIDPSDTPHRTVDDARAETKERVHALAERMEQEGFRVAESVGEGNSGAEILRAVEEHGFDTTVMGAGRYTWLKARLLGTTSTYVLQNSPTSVMLVHETREGDGKVKVLVATDGSDDAERAIGSFSKLADPGRCEVKVVTVADPVTEEAQRKVDSAISLLDQEGIAATGEVLEGAAAPRLIEMSHDEGFDLVVFGSRGLGAVRSALLGSVSEQLARLAPASFVVRSLRAK